MLCAYIFNVKIINYKGEHDGPPLMEPEAGSGFALVVAGETYTLFKELVGKDDGFW